MMLIERHCLVEAGQLVWEDCFSTFFEVKRRELFGISATCSGVPCAICPPAAPPRPMSIIQSAHLIMSILCSTTTTVLPRFKRRSVPKAVREYLKVQSYSWFVIGKAFSQVAFESSAANFMRWLSPPERVC